MLIAQEVKQAAAEAFGVTVEDISGLCREPRFARPRFAICAAVRWNTNWSMTRIARIMGRDRSTVKHAISRAANLYDDDEGFRAAMDAIEAAVWGDSRAVIFKSRRAA